MGLPWEGVYMSSFRFWLLLAATLVFWAGCCFAAPVGPETARQAAAGWVALDSRPFEGSVPFESALPSIAHTDALGRVLYYVVPLDPGGCVVVSGDDRLAPIVAFRSEGAGDLPEGNPLRDILDLDMRLRMESLESETRSTAAIRRLQEGWQTLLAAASNKRAATVTAGLGEQWVDFVSDPRVLPLAVSDWYQSGEPFVYYTPNHYAAGCVATATAIIMRYHMWPRASVGTAAFSIKVDGVAKTVRLMGGDGQGGSYDWANMPVTTKWDYTLDELNAIGRLHHDLGAVLNMKYDEYGGATDTLKVGPALRNTFAYASAVRATPGYADLSGTVLNAMVNPGLDAGLPSILGIRGDGYGHAVVVDGYGYQANLTYHHLNMGWGGGENAWYNLPHIDGTLPFTMVYKCIYNIHPSLSGTVVSGRVLDEQGNPVEGVTVRAVSGTTERTDVSDMFGVFGIMGMPASATVSLSAEKSGYSFGGVQVSTGRNVDGGTGCGNVASADLAGVSTGEGANIVGALEMLLQ